jgi:DivIVA domain-containing protein
MNTSDIAAQEFPVVRKGYDPSAVRAFLARLSETGVIGEVDVEALEEAARSDAARIIAEAEADAAALRAQAVDEATAIRAAAESDAAQKLDAAQLALTEAAAVHELSVVEADERLSAAIDQARRLVTEAAEAAEAKLADATVRSQRVAESVLADAKQRLQRLLDAETEVHVRLTAAFASVAAPADHPIERDDETLLDLAFAEFFASDVEHDESRAWILSETNG